MNTQTGLLCINKDRVRLEAFKFLGTFGKNIKTKLSNVCGKTGQYNVPSELFQKRTARNNRVLIPWKTVKNNHLTMQQLESFSGGVAVEFINNDFFNKTDDNNKLFKDLKNLIGSDNIVSSIISIRSEAGSSSSAIQREAFNKLTNNTIIRFKGEDIKINIDNYNKFAIKQTETGGTGNEKWDGFLYVSIKGGQQDTIETHRGLELTIFNPACEYASPDVRTDIDLTVAYFAMLSIDTNELEPSQKNKFNSIFDNLKNALKECHYDSEDYKGNLLDYVQSHPSTRIEKGKLMDVIQLKQINIKDFGDETRNSDSIDFTHNEAVIEDRFYWDTKKECLLSPARPTNIFWSFHLSNMMQQNYDLESYFDYEEKRYLKRKELLNL